MSKVFTFSFLVLSFVSICSFGQQPQPGAQEGSHGLKVSRPTANPVLAGTVVIKAVDLNNDSPFLRVKGTDGSSKDYLIQTCDETCQKTLNACKGGEQCSIRGKVDETTPSIMAEFVRVGAATTKSGQVFTRDTSNSKLGEAWRDPSGMVWGDIVKKDDGTPRFMNHKDATDYCKSIGAELPSREDFIRLREYMGAKSGSSEGYTPQVIPNLTYTEGGETRSRYFWSSSVHPDYSNYAYYFGGRDGYIVSYSRYNAGSFSVRCVVARR